MRTTIRLDDELLSYAKQLAAQSGRTLNAVIEDALRESLARRHKARKRRQIRLPVFMGRGVKAGVDIDSSAALLDLMEEPHEAP